MELATGVAGLSHSTRNSPPSSGTGGVFSSPLRAAVVIDYENMHRVGAQLFASTEPLHGSRLNPLRLAERILVRRNSSQSTGYAPASLQQVLAFRGLPSSKHQPTAYARNLAQAERWQRDSRVRVHTRPLKYETSMTADGSPTWTAREKGIDVLCALAVVRLSRDADVDVVILASHDSDLEPALDEARSHASVKVETASWFDRQQKFYRQLNTAGSPIWNTRLVRQDFLASLDKN